MMRVANLPAEFHGIGSGGAVSQTRKPPTDVVSRLSSLLRGWAVTVDTKRLVIISDENGDAQLAFVERCG